jgi:hypothetical protein
MSPRDPVHLSALTANRAACRAYTRVVLRLRAQAESAESTTAAASEAPSPSPTSYTPTKTGGGRSFSRSSSRAPSPPRGISGRLQSRAPERPNLGTAGRGPSFKSPLFRLRRAPLLRVFVPSPDGDWLSDDGVIACEDELRAAGIVGLLRVGDVIWDAAIGDEGNVGRLVWDGNFLIVSLRLSAPSVRFASEHYTLVGPQLYLVPQW